MKLDNTDIKILCNLQGSGRMSNVQLAEKVYLSTSACHARTTRLEEMGYIKNYRADLEINRILNFNLILVEVNLKNHTYDDVSHFEEEIIKVPEIIECLAVGGGFDYMLKFMVTSITHYQETFDEVLKMNIGIDKFFSYIVTKSLKVNQEYPIKHLLHRQAAEQTPYK